MSQVIVPDDKLSLAIGKGGQNVRLAAKLTGYKIDIKSETQAVTQGIYDKLGIDYDYLIRTNNSTWINIPLLNEFLSY